MNTKLVTSLRFVISVLALLIFIPPVTANAYTSSGADGLFQPTASVVLNSSQTVFNFTSILIPTGVTVSFNSISSQPIEFLATGNVDIAGTIDLGGNSIWIQTPANISLTGSLIGSAGSSLSLYAGLGSVPALAGVPISNSGSLTIANGGSLILGGGNITLAPVPEPSEYMLMLMGFGLVGLFAKRRKNNSSNMALVA